MGLQDGSRIKPEKADSIISKPMNGGALIMDNKKNIPPVRSQREPSPLTYKNKQDLKKGEHG